MSVSDLEERIVMTPKGKSANSTTILVERRKMAPNDATNNAHVGGGQHAGIVVNKETKTADAAEEFPAHLQLEFKVFLLEAKTQTHSQESRQLRFWFRNSLSEGSQTKMAQEFFKELIAPLEFPRDYVGFIKKIMKMMQSKYKDILKTEIELRQLSESTLPTRPSEASYMTFVRVSNELRVTGFVSPDTERIHGSEDIILTEEKVLEDIESSYPNPITVKDIAKCWCATVDDVQGFMDNLIAKGLIKAVAPGCFTRVVQNETDVQVVRQMPNIASNKQPTIAIITAQFCEKLAVDALIECQETYVRYTTVGESNVYTLGNIGIHRVVCTKLPQVGHDRSAAIAAGNTTTRLLGTFQKVEHVFLVGVGGGVPHFTDYYKHIRLGDVVVGAPPDGEKYIYMHCGSAMIDEEGSYSFETKSWGPPNLILQELAIQLKEMEGDPDTERPWLKYIEEGQSLLSAQEIDFQKPPESTDKLYMSIGGSDVIEVSHPLPPEGSYDIRKDGEPRIHIGAVGSGRSVMADEQTRQDFANRLAILAFDQEFDAVVESVYGNRKDQYIIIRGICDYKDGTRGREWQPIAALAAAAFAKSIICALDPPLDE